MEKNQKKKCLKEETKKAIVNPKEIGESYDLLKAWKCFFECLDEGIGDQFGLTVEDFQGDPMSMRVDENHPGVFRVFAAREEWISGFMTPQGLQIPMIESTVLELLFNPKSKSLSLADEEVGYRHIDIPLLAEKMMTDWEPIVSQPAAWKGVRLVEMPLIKFRKKSKTFAPVLKAVMTEIGRLDFKADLRQVLMSRTTLDEYATMLHRACIALVIGRLFVAWKQPMPLTDTIHQSNS